MNYFEWKKEIDDYLKTVSRSLSKSQRELIIERMVTEIRNARLRGFSGEEDEDR